jgi:hypothetical protein
MRKNKYKLIRAILLMPEVKKCLLMLFLAKFILIGNLNAQTPKIWPTEISFNYEGGSSNDAITIKKNASSTIAAPEYIRSESSITKNENCAYIKSQGNRKIKVKFNSNNSNMNYLVKATVISGTGIGNICEMFVAPCDLNTTVFTIDIQGTIPSSVGINTFTWKWEATALPINSSYCPITCSSVNTTHTYYTLLNVPKSPETTPRTDILDYACEWANGSTTENLVCTNILSNGFNQHYTWDYQCHMLASDFVRLVSSLGINAYLHRWSSKGVDVGDMSYQLTRPFDPVGPTHGYKAIPWAWHQWAEAASYQRDPSANNSVAGNWGAYEDYLFTHYERIIASSPYYEWVENQVGQSSGCEAEGNRYYWYYPTDAWLLTSWLGPDR